jgi:hypothetical protein
MTELSAARVSSAEADEEKIFEPEPNKSWGNPEPLFRACIELSVCDSLLLTELDATKFVYPASIYLA